LSQRSFLVLALCVAAIVVAPSAPVGSQFLELGDELVAATAFEGRSVAPVAAFTHRSWVIAWERPHRGIAARMFSHLDNPQGGERMLVAADPIPTVPFRGVLEQHGRPALIGHPDGTVVLLWLAETVEVDAFPFREVRTVLYSTLQAQRFARTGEPLGARHEIGIAGGGVQGSPVAARLVSGEVIAAWAGEGADGGVWAQRMDSWGAPVADPVELDERGLRPALAARGDGTALIVWERCCGLQEDRGLFGRLLGTDNEPLGPVFAVKQVNRGTVGRAAVASLGGEFLVVWQGPGPDLPGNPRIFGQRVSLDGALVGDELEISDDLGQAHTSPAVAVQPGGPVLVSWILWNRSFRIGLWGVLLDRNGQHFGEPTRLTHGPFGAQFATALQAGRDTDFVGAWLGFDAAGRLAPMTRVLRHVDEHGCPSGGALAMRPTGPSQGCPP
jgi:hypothetical protein